MSDGRGTKRELRQAAKAYRAALSPEEICALSRRACGRAGELPAFQRAGTVMLYTAAFGETDPRSLAEEAEKLGKQVCYPVCDGRGGMLAACPGEKWERSSYGIWEPSLSGGCRVDKLLLIRQSVQNSWKGIFPLRGGALPDRGIQPGRVVEDKGFPVW